jgi:hypothetical protein
MQATADKVADAKATEVDVADAIVALSDEVDEIVESWTVASADPAADAEEPADEEAAFGEDAAEAAPAEAEPAGAEPPAEGA